MYGILCCMHLVRACVLLKINLYFGNRFCMYLVDFVAVSLVSCIVMMAGSSSVLIISSCKFGRDVFSDEAFHVMNLVLEFVVCISCGCIVGVIGSGGGWLYSCIGSYIFKVSSSSVIGRNGNLSIMF